MLKDEVYLQIAKQLTENTTPKSVLGYLQGAEVLTRYYYPSAEFICPFYNHIEALTALEANKPAPTKPEHQQIKNMTMRLLNSIQ